MLAALEHWADLHHPGLTVDPERCLHAASVFATCRVCADECPAGALRVDRSVALDAAACVGCGACVHACPVGAFTAPDAAANLLRCAVRIPDHASLELVCELCPAGERGPRPVDAAVTVSGCLAALGPSTYAALYVLGVGEVQVRVDACDACPVGARASIERTVQKAASVLRAWPDARVTCTAEPVGDEGYPRPVFEADHPPVSRRRLFAPLAADEERGLADALADVAAPEAGKGATAERRRLIKALAALPPAGQVFCPTPLAGQTFMQHGVDVECSACGACAKACPTGALALDVDDAAQTYSLTHRPAICAGCHTCIDLCERGALYASGVPLVSALQADRAVVISAGRFERCARCGARLPVGAADADGLCELCAFRRANPFGSRLPERMRARVGGRSAPDHPPPSS